MRSIDYQCSEESAWLYLIRSDASFQDNRSAVPLKSVHRVAAVGERRAVGAVRRVRDGRAQEGVREARRLGPPRQVLGMK